MTLVASNITLFLEGEEALLKRLTAHYLSQGWRSIGDDETFYKSQWSLWKQTENEQGSQRGVETCPMNTLSRTRIRWAKRRVTATQSNSCEGERRRRTPFPV